jgi:quinoprotein glucose dehydrogenase
MPRAGCLVTVLVALLGSSAFAQQNADWPNVGNDKGGQRYAALDQINRDNVARLQPAWTYHTGDSAPGATIECTPIVIDGVMYVTTVTTKVVALDAATGKERWKYDPYAAEPDRKWIKASGGVNRGVAYWSDGQGDARVLLGASDGRLISLDAKTGKPDPAFGKGGAVDLREGVRERDLTGQPYGPTSAPAVFENLVFVSFSCNEGVPAAPGDVRAFDVRTGKEVWRFHTIPWPGEANHDTWHGDEWKQVGAANPWGGFTIDAKNGVLFCGTGSVAPDFWGGGRKGPNLYGNCTLALDARTGKRLWHFQTVRHDLWDHDIPCPPVVVTIKRDGKEIEAVAQVTKTAHCWVFDRKTGEPVFGVKEEPAPPSEIPGEDAAKTQPVPVKPPAFSRRVFGDDEATSISPEAHAYVLTKLKTLRHGGPNLPPSEPGTVELPGFHGGATWSGASFDPTTGLLYVNSNDIPFVSAVKPHPKGGYQFQGYGYFKDADGYPAVKPPWGLLNAIDLNAGEIAWQVPLGEYPELTAKGIPQTGTENFGGTIVTKGGLVFIGGSKDERFHAFDARTGKLLWQTQLPAGGYATPSTYMAKGKQYVVIAAGGGGKQRTKSGDAFVAFALPEGSNQAAAK